MIPTIREKYTESIGNGASGGAIAAPIYQKSQCITWSFPTEDEQGIVGAKPPSALMPGMNWASYEKLGQGRRSRAGQHWRRLVFSITPSATRDSLRSSNSTC